MSSVVAVDRSFAPSYMIPTPVRSRSCPGFIQRQVIRREEPVAFKALRELITTGRVNFVCLDDSTTIYCGRVVQVKDVKALAQEKGYRIFKSLLYIHCHETIPSGTVYLQLTTHDPAPKGF